MSVAEVEATSERELVLAADDNDQNLELLEEYLWQWGYDVIVARDGREAVDLFPQHNPSLVVLDVMMPVMDGYEACARIKSTQQGRRIPIVMLTALTGTDDKIRALDHGADDFLNKPINKEELRTRIRSLIKIRNLRKDLDSSENIIVTLTSALENKDPRSGGHVHRVASYSAQICDRLGMGADDREIVLKGALLHDLGMIGIAEEILLKNTPLDDSEQRALEQHARMGASILKPLRTFQSFIPMVRWHHERMDGRGYPDGLAGKDIPIEARIVAVANRFDEIRHEGDLPGQTQAIEQLKKEANEGGFDPEIVRCLEEAVADAPMKIPSGGVAIRRPQLTPRVLCVDDSKLNRDLISATLTDVGLEVLHAEDGPQALKILETENIDIILLDLIMPQQSGEETLQAIRRDARFQFLPVIVLTAHKNVELRQKAIVSGADDFLSYPLNRLELITRIRSLLRIKDYHSDLEQTRGHSQRVGDLAYTFGRHLGIPRERADLIRTAGLLHDIGKIAVPQSLLNKPGPLTRDEFIKVIDHPVVGEEICRPLQTLSSVLKLIRHHHERFDGRGYPDGLKGEELPEEVRLLSIVDAYDALTSHRSYRPAPLSHRSALETLLREAEAGKWDPEMVNRFCEMLGDSGPDFAAMSLPAVPTLQLE